MNQKKGLRMICYLIIAIAEATLSVSYAALWWTHRQTEAQLTALPREPSRPFEQEKH